MLPPKLPHDSAPCIWTRPLITESKLGRYSNQEDPSIPNDFGGLRLVSLGLFGSLGQQFTDKRRTLKTSQTRHEDFQSSYRRGTMCHHRSLLASIQAFNAGLNRSILPIRTHKRKGSLKKICIRILRITKI
jgi:hypothetical protein